MPSELLNNYIQNTHVQKTLSPQVSTVQPVLQNAPVQKKQNISANIISPKSDVFENKNNKKILVGKIAAGTLFFGGSFIFLAKKGKLGAGLENFINKIFKSKAAPAAANSAQAVTEKVNASGAKKYLPPEIYPEKINDETGEILYRAKVTHNPKSVADDIADWAAMRAGLPKMSQLTSGNPINPAFSDFEIKPHKYADDTKVFISARDYTKDFTNYEVDNGVMKRLKDALQESIKEPSATEMFDLQKNKRCLQTGHFDNGKKYVTFAYANGETYENGRLGYETVMLVSNGSEFTQSQKDIIRIFKTLDDNLSPTAPIPLYFASATAGGVKPSLTDSELVKRFNKNALLSAISSWAEHSPEFDTDKYIEKAGDTFRTGIKCAKLGNLNQID